MIREYGRRSWILAAIFLAAACTGGPKAVYEPVPPETRTIVFQAAPLDGIQPDVRVRVTEDTREEFARWDAQGARSGFWHGATFTGRQWLPTPDGQTGRALRYWRDLHEPGFALREGGTTATPLGEMRYWRFRLQGGWFDCFAINHFWTPSAGSNGTDDVGQGYRDWLNGYYCTTDGEALTDEEIAGILSTLRIDRTSLFPALGSR